ncbi:MAG: hypothetical protein EXS36_08275 [Pedosphaera sp.]|nr:hypothetical protein [Pedosphaera sp.]
MNRSSLSSLKLSLSALALAAIFIPTFAAPPPVPPPAPQVVKLLSPDPIAFAPNSSGAFTILRADGTSSDLIVALEIGGTAVNGVDYEKLPTDVTIPAGALAVDLVIRPLLSAPLSAENKTVELTLKPNLGYIVGTKKPSTVTLVQDLFNDLPPVVSITTPKSGAVVAGPVIEIEANAADTQDGIARVSFFVGDTLVGVATAPPYSVHWTNTSGLKKYALFAKAVDKIGQTSLSKAVEVTVSNTLATVVLTAPKHGAVVVPGSIISLSATVTGSPGPVTKVDFLANGRVIGSAATEPYNFTWLNAKPGHYQVAARAEDAFGAVGESDQAALYVSNTLPVVAITGPSEGRRSNVKNGIQFTANATDPDGSISRVSFYVDHKFLGNSSNAPFQFVWTQPTLGSHLLIARAYDLAGSAANSPGVTFVVTNQPPAVSLTSPSNNQIITLPTPVNVSASVTAGDAAVVKVNFWANNKLVGKATKAPYQLTWSNPALGSYVLSAHVLDSQGVVTISQPILIQVKAAGL